MHAKIEIDLFKGEVLQNTFIFITFVKKIPQNYLTRLLHFLFILSYLGRRLVFHQANISSANRVFSWFQKVEQLVNAYPLRNSSEICFDITHR